jgi:hypothetical protein
MALDKFGVAHATTTLARGNLVDALDLLGEREEARSLLNNSVNGIKEVRGGPQQVGLFRRKSCGGTAVLPAAPV